MGWGQGALWGVWAHATGWPQQGQRQGQEEGPASGKDQGASVIRSQVAFCSNLLYKKNYVDLF